MLHDCQRKMEFVDRLSKIHRSVFTKVVQKIEAKEGECFEEIIKNYFGTTPEEECLQLYYAFKVSVGRSVAFVIYLLLKERLEENTYIIEKIGVLSRVQQFKEEYDRYGDIVDDMRGQPILQALFQIK